MCAERNRPERMDDTHCGFPCDISSPSDRRWCICPWAPFPPHVASRCTTVGPPWFVSYRCVQERRSQCRRPDRRREDACVAGTSEEERDARGFSCWIPSLDQPLIMSMGMALFRGAEKMFGVREKETYQSKPPKRGDVGLNMSIQLNKSKKSKRETKSLRALVTLQPEDWPNSSQGGIKWPVRQAPRSTGHGLRP